MLGTFIVLDFTIHTIQMVHFTLRLVLAVDYK